MSRRLLLIPAESGNVDSAQIYIDIQPFGADIQDINEVGEVYIDIDASGVETLVREDAATIYVDLQPGGFECYSTFSGVYLGEGEATLEWSGAAVLNWSGEANLEWSIGDPQVDGETC